MLKFKLANETEEELERFLSAAEEYGVDRDELQVDGYHITVPDEYEEEIMDLIETESLEDDIIDEGDDD